MSRGVKGTGSVWDAKGADVPGGRMTRSLFKGLGKANAATRKTEIARRRRALDMLRAQAGAVDDERDRAALWNLIPTIGKRGFPSWEEIVAARSPAEFLALAHRGEHHLETNARRERDAQVSERRTGRHSVDEYLTWKEKKGFSPDGIATDASILRRALEVLDAEGVPYGERRLATLWTEDGERILDDLAFSSRLPEGQTHVAASTHGKNHKTLHAWYAWELTREQERSIARRRDPAYSINIFRIEEKQFSRPMQGRDLTIEQKEESRRFTPEECARLEAHARLPLKHAMPVKRRLGLRPGELQHLRWGIDVIPLPDGSGYEVRIQGGRGRDPRCPCRPCRSGQGWKPKNGPRRYILRREYDAIGWVTPAIDAIDAWVTMTEPEHGAFLFPDPADRNRAWTNAKLNKALRETGRRAGIEVGQRAPGRRTAHSFRHACACEMLEFGVPDPLAAEWIGDTLKEFRKTYGRPDPDAIARETLARRTAREEGA